MRALAIVLLTLGLAAPAQAQVPCGLFSPCPTPAPPPPSEPTATPSPTPAPDVPVIITLQKPPSLHTVAHPLKLRGRVTGAGEALHPESPQLELVVTSTTFGRTFGPYDVSTNSAGGFAISVGLQTNATYVVRAKAGSGLTGRSVPRRVRAFASLDYFNAGYDDTGARPSFAVTVEIRAPSTLRFSEGVVHTGGSPRRAYLYVGKGRRLARVASSRLRKSVNEGAFTTVLQVPAARLPRGGFRYQACFPGRGARGLTPAFVNCGARYFRAG